jgi:hypothetical protein
MFRATGAVGIATLILIGVSGCGQSLEATSSSVPSTIDKSKFILAEEPDDAVGVMIAREDAKDKEEIVLLGRIGGRENPWIKGRSAFMVIDASMNVVASGEESGSKQVCLDDCCATLRKGSTMLVKIVDAQGRTLPIDARQLLDVDANDIVVVKGKVQRDKDSCSVAATGVYVRR